MKSFLFILALAVVFVSPSVPTLAMTEPNPADDEQLQQIDIGVSSTDSSQQAVVQQICDAGVSTFSDDCDEANTGGVLSLIDRLLGGLSIVIGAIAVVVIIVAGIQYAVSNGDGQKLSTARNSIVYAAIALVVVVFARAIVSFILGRV